MRLERRRSSRHPFAASAEIIDEREHARSSSKVCDLSLHGCYVEMANPFPQGTNVFVEVYSGEEFLEAHATVAYCEPLTGMGLNFSDLQPHFASVLKKWLSRSAPVRA